MYSRMSAPVPQALAVSSEPIALTSSVSKVKAPTISEIHIMAQQAPVLTSVSKLFCPCFFCKKKHSELEAPKQTQNKIPHALAKVHYVYHVNRLCDPLCRPQFSNPTSLDSC